MNNVILSPFYSIKEDKLMYLEKQEICKLPLNKDIRQVMLKNEGVFFTKVDKLNDKESVIVLEPHPDDFALSALGYSLGKYNVIVLNIFSSMNIDSFTWKENIQINEKDYEKLRLQESELSTNKILGQKFLSLREKSTRITSKTNNYIENKIIESTKEILNQNPTIKTMLVPMGIGNHPDHLIVYNAIMNAYSKDKQLKIILYPEFPYARCRKDYNERIKQIEKNYKLKPIVINIESKIDILADAISAYRSQFDDINRNQMLAIIREDYRAIAQEYKKDYLSIVYYEIEEVINENKFF